MTGYSFTARQVSAITGISRPVLGDLIKRKLVSPSKQRAAGRGENNLFDIADLFGLAVVEFLRPKVETNDLLHAAFRFWHTADGRRLLDDVRERRAASVIVFDGSGNVTVEDDGPVSELAARLRSATLHIVEPNALAHRLFHEVAMHRMAGDHAEPNPSGREPRKRKPARQTRSARSTPVSDRDEPSTRKRKRSRRTS